MVVEMVMEMLISEVLSMPIATMPSMAAIPPSLGKVPTGHSTTIVWATHWASKVTTSHWAGKVATSTEASATHVASATTETSAATTTTMGGIRLRYRGGDKQQSAYKGSYCNTYSRSHNAFPHCWRDRPSAAHLLITQLKRACVVPFAYQRGDRLFVARPYTSASDWPLIINHVVAAWNLLNGPWWGEGLNGEERLTIPQSR
jgi:hypothetical protein